MALPWIAAHVPTEAVAHVPWSVSAFQWDAGINVVLLSLVSAHRIYRRSFGMQRSAWGAGDPGR